jgi:hypothetical protein
MPDLGFVDAVVLLVALVGLLIGVPILWRRARRSRRG